MTKEELAHLRDEELATVQQLRKVGDYDANAGNIRAAHEKILALAQHLLDRMR